VRLLLAFAEGDARNKIQRAATEWDPGIDCCIAGSATEALEETHHEHWDLLILDAHLGDAQGMRLRDAIAELKRSATETPLVVVTRQMSADEVIDAARAGAAAYLDLKSMEPLLAVVERYDRPSSSRRAVRRRTSAEFLANIRQITTALTDGVEDQPDRF
jgi:DNA-binding response OmpR family regulator